MPVDPPWPELTDENFFMFMRCRSLERVSVKNASFDSSPDVDSSPVTQEMLIKFVRRTPSLRWLRSDLTEENTVMLQQERPEITFVTD